MKLPSFNLAQTNHNQSIETVLSIQESSENTIPKIQFVQENSLGLGLFLAIPLLMTLFSFLRSRGEDTESSYDDDENMIPTFFNLDVAINNVRLSNYLKVNISANIMIKVKDEKKAIQAFGGAENVNELTISNFINRRIEHLIRNQISNLIKTEKPNSEFDEKLKNVEQEVSDLSTAIKSYGKLSDGSDFNDLSESIQKVINGIKEDYTNPKQTQEQLEKLIYQFDQTIQKIKLSTQTNDNQSVLSQNLKGINESLTELAGNITFLSSNSENNTEFTKELTGLTNKMYSIYKDIKDTDIDNSQPMELSSELKNITNELKEAKENVRNFQDNYTTSQNKEETFNDKLSEDLKRVTDKINTFEREKKEQEDDITLIINKIESTITNFKLEEQLAFMQKVYNINNLKTEEIKIKNLELLGLEIVDFIVSNVEENDNYDSNSFLDSLAIKERNKLMQNSLKTSQLLELEINKTIEIKQLETEKKISEYELENEKEITLKKLKIEQEIEEQQISYDTQSLRETEKIQLAQLEQERNIEVRRLAVEALIQAKEEEENTKVEQAKMAQEIELAEQTKALQLLQLENQQAVEVKEMEILANILKEEKAKLDEEKVKVQVEESIKTVIEEEKEKCRLNKAQNTAKTAEQEAIAISHLARAEGERYNLIPPNNTAQINQIIKELILNIIKKDKLTELATVLEKLQPELGNNNFYTFPADKGDGVNQLMLSSSGMLLLKTLLENMKNENGTKP